MTPALDIEALLALQRSIFGDARMDAADDDKADDDADDTDADKVADDASDDDATAADKAAEEKAAADALGDKGKQALDRMKAKWQKERDARTAAEKALADSKKPAEGDDKPDVDKIRADAESAATAKVNERIIRSEIRAAAAGKMQDPKDALAHLDMSQFEVDADGNVDETEIADAIDELLERKPYLGVTQGDKQKKFQGGADGGARGKASKSQLTEADVKRLAGEGKHSEIEQARVDGRLNELLGIK